MRLRVARKLLRRGGAVRGTTKERAAKPLARRIWRQCMTIAIRAVCNYSPEGRP